MFASGDIKIKLQNSLFLDISSGTKPQIALKNNSYFSEGFAIYNSQLVISDTHLCQSKRSHECSHVQSIAGVSSNTRQSEPREGKTQAEEGLWKTTFSIYPLR